MERLVYDDFCLLPIDSEVSEGLGWIPTKALLKILPRGCILLEFIFQWDFDPDIWAAFWALKVL